MALIFTLVTLYLLSKRLYAGPVPAVRTCQIVKLPVAVTAVNAEYQLVDVKNNIDAAAFAVDIDTWSSLNATRRLIKNITVSGTYNISAQLCVSAEGIKKDHLHIATHGLGFDKRYWDAAVNPAEYSYVDAALAAGYSVLTYDRLGTGLSDKPDAYTVVQAPLQLQILRAITEMARDGRLSKFANGSLNVSFKKIIHVGHSYGSFLTEGLLYNYGNLSDAAIVTGFIADRHFQDQHWTSFDLAYAAENDPKLFGDRPAGYVVPATSTAMQANFFSTRTDLVSEIGGFELDVLEYAFSIRQALAVAEVVSPAQVPAGIATDFAGAVQFVVGQFDYLNCLGDCSEAADLGFLQTQYPKAKVNRFVQPGTGHGLTLHKGARQGYRKSLDWLGRVGL